MLVQPRGAGAARVVGRREGVSDEARRLISADDRGSGASEIVERAVQLVDDASAVLERAVVYEREQRASWQTIGAAIGTSRHTAHERGRSLRSHVGQPVP